ncbi:MAG: cation transporter, partial [Anaerolineaceae bacterium]|nr:cation transporter [Anaerolineaceae bacterium]
KSYNVLIGEIKMESHLFSKDQKNMKIALWLSAFTILVNLVEGGFSTFFGAQDETLALFGFGIDSFVEVISAVGITMMLVRTFRNPDSTRSSFEGLALKMTGVGFYLLTAGLVVTSILSLINQQRPETTLMGIIISLISLSVMIFLYRAKLKTGRELNSAAIIADANCTKTCIYMSVVLLVSSLTFALTGFGLLDVLGALGIAWFAFNEGKEAFEKARGVHKDCCN